MGGVAAISLSNETMLQHWEYCTPDQRTGGVKKERTEYSKKEFNEVSTDKKEIL